MLQITAGKNTRSYSRYIAVTVKNIQILSTQALVNLELHMLSSKEIQQVCLNYEIKCQVLKVFK